MSQYPPRARDWFTVDELAYLRASRLGRLATVDQTGAPQAKPVSYAVTMNGNGIDIVGHRITASAKWRNIVRDPRVAFVVDDPGDGTYDGVSGIEIRGRATLHDSSTDPSETARIRIHPDRVLAWNLPPVA